MISTIEMFGELLYPAISAGIREFFSSIEEFKQDENKKVFLVLEITAKRVFHDLNLFYYRFDIGLIISLRGRDFL